MSILQRQLQGGLPTLKELVQSGQLTPGKLVLSCYAKGRTHRASLTPLGKIRTQEGFVFVTASQWVSTLTEPVSVKKKKAYEMVLYKGRSLLSICLNCHYNALPNERPTNTAPVSTIMVDITKSFTEQGTQVKDTDILELLPQKTECEIRLNSLLSNCVVRLLTEQDFVSCDDLPDNFWREDFSKVRLPKDIWDTVDSW
ncbi:uncharacterized protein LOC132723952 [Ruditapes philippinarum]|uniref:uncharacterized protein LOC132723952 n=1 Tax=Ruditapes philippinarum TaxID=129788 RepID=UPI00295AFF83|nr:uncharacterized protein LOC132723952 [Ruditapes philippinarum]